MPKILKLEPATNKRHKWIAFFDDGTKTRFGAKGYEDFTTHGDLDRRERYKARHAKDLRTNDPRKAGFLSYYILWGDSTDINENIKTYNRRFG